MTHIKAGVSQKRSTGFSYWNDRLSAELSLSKLLLDHSFSQLFDLHGIMRPYLRFAKN